MHTRRASIAALLCAALSACSTVEGGLRPFTTDGCSLFPDRSVSTGQDWCLCCVAHDRAYWRGGTASARREADQALRACVLAATGDDRLAALMYRGVRIGGSPFLPTPFRWGYGWPYGRFYAENGPEEDALADRLEAAYAGAVGFGTCPSSGTR